VPRTRRAQRRPGIADLVIGVYECQQVTRGGLGAGVAELRDVARADEEHRGAKGARGVAGTVGRSVVDDNDLEVFARSGIPLNTANAPLEPGRIIANRNDE
jgi:hypothetical protein